MLSHAIPYIGERDDHINDFFGLRSTRVAYSRTTFFVGAVAVLLRGVLPAVVPLGIRKLQWS